MLLVLFSQGLVVTVRHFGVWMKDEAGKHLLNGYSVIMMGLLIYRWSVRYHLISRLWHEHQTE